MRDIRGSVLWPNVYYSGKPHPSTPRSTIPLAVFDTTTTTTTTITVTTAATVHVILPLHRPSYCQRVTIARLNRELLCVRVCVKGTFFSELYCTHSQATGYFPDPLYAWSFRTTVCYLLLFSRVSENLDIQLYTYTLYSM